MLRARERIGEVYAQRVPGVGNADVDERVTRFFTECHDMRDWLRGDIGNLAGVSAQDITDHAATSPPLVTGSAVANSHKHHTRKPGTTTARIRSTHMTPAGATVVIEVDWASPTSTMVDALNLADECVASWRHFLARHAIAEP